MPSVREGHGFTGGGVGDQLAGDVEADNEDCVKGHIVFSYAGASIARFTTLLSTRGAYSQLRSVCGSSALYGHLCHLFTL